LRLINNTIVRVVAKRANAPVMPPIRTMLVDWFVLGSLLVVLEGGVWPVFVFCEPISVVVPIVGVEIAVATAVVTVVGVKCCIGVGSNVGRGVGDGIGVGVGVKAL
jgi:hypothetical protein